MNLHQPTKRKIDKYTLECFGLLKCPVCNELDQDKIVHVKLEAHSYGTQCQTCGYVAGGTVHDHVSIAYMRFVTESERLGKDRYASLTSPGETAML